MISMTNADEPSSKFRDKLRRLSEKVDQLAAGTAVQQMTEEVREEVSEISHLVKDCEREWTKTAKVFEGEIGELRLANETLQAKGALHEAVFEDSDDGIV